MSKITYTKLRDGSWGIRSTEELNPRSIVYVTKKSGEEKAETVGTLVWSGNGVWLYTVGGRSSSSSYGRGRGRGYGGPLPGGRWPEGSPGYYSSGQYDDES